MLATEKPVRILPKDVYDTMEFSALVFGGIGAGRWRDAADPDCPVCAVGHLLIAGVLPNDMAYTLDIYGWDEEHSDEAVFMINARKGRSDYSRVTFPEWCAELGVVRGE